MDRLEVLKKSELFRDLNDEQLNLVEKYALPKNSIQGQSYVSRAN